MAPTIPSVQGPGQIPYPFLSQSSQLDAYNSNNNIQSSISGNNESDSDAWTAVRRTQSLIDRPKPSLRLPTETEIEREMDNIGNINNIGNIGKIGLRKGDSGTSLSSSFLPILSPTSMNSAQNDGSDVSDNIQVKDRNQYQNSNQNLYQTQNLNQNMNQHRNDMNNFTGNTIGNNNTAATAMNSTPLYETNKIPKMKSKIRSKDWRSGVQRGGTTFTSQHDLHMEASL